MHDQELADTIAAERMKAARKRLKRKLRRDEVAKITREAERFARVRANCCEDSSREIDLDEQAARIVKIVESLRA
jgi:RecB family exonuclease